MCELFKLFLTLLFLELLNTTKRLTPIEESIEKYEKNRAEKKTRTQYYMLLKQFEAEEDSDYEYYSDTELDEDTEEIDELEVEWEPDVPVHKRALQKIKSIASHKTGDYEDDEDYPDSDYEFGSHKSPLKRIKRFVSRKKLNKWGHQEKTVDDEDYEYEDNDEEKSLASKTEKKLKFFKSSKKLDTSFATESGEEKSSKPLSTLQRIKSFMSRKNLNEIKKVGEDDSDANSEGEEILEKKEKGGRFQRLKNFVSRKNLNKPENRDVKNEEFSESKYKMLTDFKSEEILDEYSNRLSSISDIDSTIEDDEYSFPSIPSDEEFGNYMEELVENSHLEFDGNYDQGIETENIEEFTQEILTSTEAVEISTKKIHAKKSVKFYCEPEEDDFPQEGNCNDLTSENLDDDIDYESEIVKPPKKKKKKKMEENGELLQNDVQMDENNGVGGITQNASDKNENVFDIESEAEIAKPPKKKKKKKKIEENSEHLLNDVHTESGQLGAVNSVNGIAPYVSENVEECNLNESLNKPKKKKKKKKKVNIEIDNIEEEAKSEIFNPDEQTHDSNSILELQKRRRQIRHQSTVIPQQVIFTTTEEPIPERIITVKESRFIKELQRRNTMPFNQLTKIDKIDRKLELELLEMLANETSIYRNESEISPPKKKKKKKKKPKNLENGEITLDTQGGETALNIS